MSEALQVKELRERTGAGFMDCKKALSQSGNDLEKAIVFLREKGLAAAAKKAGRAANEGRVGSYVHGDGKIAVMVEINCETDFVARTDVFQAFSRDIAMHIAAANPRYLDKSVVTEADLQAEREILKKQAEEQGKKGPVVDKIVDGRINKFFEENCLLHQRFVKDADRTVEEVLKEAIAKLGENIQIRRFVRFQIGETVAKAE